MALYDRYSDVMRGHPPWVQRMEARRQERILDWIGTFLPAGAGVRAVEVGVGIGLFARACRARGWDYTGIDRNRKIVEQIGAEFRIVEAEVPPWPKQLPLAAYDLAYSAFVLEHMADGSAAYAFVRMLKEALVPGGVVALIVPDALSLGMEFWNLDYTHRYPTAERNVTQILLENELKVERVIRYRGAAWTGWRYWLLRMVAAFYSYRLWSAVTGQKDLCYSVYQYARQDILVFIARAAAK